MRECPRCAGCIGIDNYPTFPPKELPPAYLTVPYLQGEEKDMKRNMLLITGLLLLALLAVACGGGGGATTEPTAAPVEEVATEAPAEEMATEVPAEEEAEAPAVG